VFAAGLEVLASRLPKRDASGREEPGGQPEGVQVRVSIVRPALFSARRQLEGAHQVGYPGVRMTGGSTI
jgi:hypothetical protein